MQDIAEVDMVTDVNVVLLPPPDQQHLGDIHQHVVGEEEEEVATAAAADLRPPSPAPSSETQKNAKLEFSEFMERRRVGKGAEFTHTQLGRTAGAFYLPFDDMSRFYRLYAKAIDAGVDLHVTERHRHISPVCIDVDLRFAASSNPEADLERRYTRELVDALIREYAVSLLGLLGPSGVEGKEFYVMEKPSPRPSKGLIKDGFHIMAPGIVTRTSLQHIAREEVLRRPLFAELGATNSADDILDAAVISRNNWFMYSSKKPEAGELPYLVSRIVTVAVSDDGGVELASSDDVARLGVRELTEILSLRNKHEETPVVAERMVDVLEREAEEVKHKRRQVTERTMLEARENGPDLRVTYDGSDIDRLRSTAALISSERMNSYDGWMRVGWCLKNIDESLIDTWIELSKRSEKYVDGQCERLWQRMRRGTLGVGTLHMWARADDPAGYAALRGTLTIDLIQQCSPGAHNDIARVVYGMFQHRFVCSGIRSHQWYEFVGHRWKQSDAGYSLRKRLSNEVWREFMDTSGRLTHKAIQSSSLTEQQQLTDSAKRIMEIAIKLKITLFKDHVMKECAEMFYQEKFEEKLDANINLIGFENGVYDLDADEFREGRPDDFITFTTGNNYLEYDENSVASDGVQRYLAQVLTQPLMREYVMKLFASFLHGATKEQKFYVWTGSGSNSKSKLVELFELAFGDYCCKLPVTLLTQKRAASNAAQSEVAKSKGKRFACMQEPSEDEKMNVGLMKELSGGDKIMARALYKEPVEFKPQFKMILLCNHLPEVPSDDGGTWRRIRVVEFTSKFVDKPNLNSLENEFPIDLDLSVKMETWKEAFMGLLVKYYKRYTEEGILEPEEVMRCTNEYKKQNDQLAEFVENFIKKEPTAFLSLSETYTEAKSFARDANIVKFVNRKVFDKYMERSLNAKTILVNGVKGLRGFQYTPPQKDKDSSTNNIEEGFRELVIS